MEWESIAASGVLSAFISWAVASRVTVRQERAKRREAGLIAMREVVQPLQDKLSRYRFAKRRERAEREHGESLHLDDLDQVIIVRRAASPMSLWRRWLIDRRLGKIYGKGLVGLARDYPSAHADAGSAGFATWLAVSMSGHRLANPMDALLHRTYSAPPTSGLGKKLARQLRWLARGW